MNKVRLKQLTGTKENNLSGSKGYQTKGLMNQKLDDINSRMEEDDKQDGNQEDHRPGARESQDDDDVSDSEEEPSKKRRRKESFSLGCEVL